MAQSPGSTGAPVPVRKRASFKVPKKQPKPKAPRADDLDLGPMRAMAPPRIVLDKIGNPDLVIGIDIETHDWLDDQNTWGRYGKFGFWMLHDEQDLAYARIIQLGWVVGCPQADAPLVISKSKFVQPDGFEVSAKATKVH